MNTKKNSYYALAHLFGMFLCIFCLTMLMLIRGLPPIVNYGFFALTVVQATGLFWYLLANRTPKYRFLSLLLFLIRISTFCLIGAAVYLYLTMASQFHNILKPDASGNISTLDMEAVENAENCYVFQTDNLYILFPQYQRIAAVFDNCPSMNDDSLTYFATSAFFKKEEFQFHHENVVGDHAQDGIFYEGAKEDGLSAFTFYDGQAHFVFDNPDEAIKLTAENGGDGFEQFMTIWDGKAMSIRMGKLRCFRMLAELNGRVCLIESTAPMKYDEYIKSVVDLGVKKAIYLDMGGKSSYSKYRNNDGNPVNLFGKPGEFVHSWIAFYK